MHRSHLNAWILTGSILSAWLYAASIAAQVIPDNTLPAGERSQVSGNATVKIDGGAQRGPNLFHSFSQFSVPTGGSAYFNNAADVQNIFSRVTGGSSSTIEGVLRANGTANLFLLNPNGILFGPNARLNLGGSFVASTANSIVFADKVQYSAINPQPASLLTVSVPIGLQMGANPGRIEVQGNGYDLSITVPIFSPIIRGSSAAGLRVPAGQTLALVGGDVDITGGRLTAEQGRIELGSVRGGQVNFSSTTAGFAFAYQASQGFGDIRFSRQALADASGGGLVQVQGNQVSLADGSIILIQNQGTQAGGRISVNAIQSFNASGASPNGRIYGGLRSETVGSKSGADIAISTTQLVVQRGAVTSTTSFGSGKAGNATVNASDSVRVDGVSSVNPTLGSGISSGVFNAPGDGGTVTVSAGKVSILNGGNIASSNFGAGQGGAVTINATESVEISGFIPRFLLPSAVAANTASSGNAGKATINTSRLVLRNGGAVTTSTTGTGSAGTITINARESVEVSGRVPGSPNPTALRASAAIVPGSLLQVFEVPPELSGGSGNITVNTGKLSVLDGAKVEVSNARVGNAGILTIHANSIVLDTKGTITAATAFGEGGNINLTVRDFLLLRNNSPITASAGGTGNGGNIKINAGSIVAVPSENSDIRANSVNARGGNVTINASGIFGIQFRPQDTPLSDITATGASSALSGTVQLNIERLDPTSGLIELPTTLVDSSRLIAQGCPANQGNSFVITGRGGLPPNPEQQLDDDAPWSDRRRLAMAGSNEPGTTERRGHGETSTPLPTASRPPIIEATAWQITPTGTIALIATAPNARMHNPLSRLVVCPERR